MHSENYACYIVCLNFIMLIKLLLSQHIQAHNLQNTGGKPHLQLFDLNPDHTHFILVEDCQMESEALSNFRYALEMRFTKPVGKPRRYRQFPTSISTLCEYSSVLIITL